MLKTWSIIGTDSSTLWKGSVGTSPSSKHLQTILAACSDENNILDLTAQVICNGDPKTISSTLNIISCHRWRIDGEINTQRMVSLPNANNRTICGLLFKKGLVVWTCRQCAKDPTCVQCDECFRLSDHEGHEVYFHRASGSGGCCDCGDPEAWSDKGNCRNHGCRQSDKVSDPLSVVPRDLYEGMKSVVKTAVGLVTSYVVSCTRGYHPAYKNKYLIESIWPREVLVTRLHNDDVHTYDEVTSALVALGMSAERAADMTVAVDKDGHSVTSIGYIDSVREPYRILADEAGLLVSVIPERIFAMDSRIAAVLSWLLFLGTTNDGFKRVVVECMLTDVSTLPTCASVVTAAPGLESFAPDCIFNDPDQFPSVIPLTPDDIIGIDDLTRIEKPFADSPHSALSVLMMSTPFLTKAIKKCFNDMVVLFQHDEAFKPSFSQCLTLLYPSLNGLYCRAVGTSEDSLFNTSVQVFTADSVVQMMSSEGVQSRPFPEHNPVYITKMLTSTLLASLYDFGCVPNRTSDEFLDSPAVHHRRMWHVCRDLEYVTESYPNVVRVLAGEKDPGALEDWLQLCASLQLIDRVSRRTDTHIEQEDVRWQVAANLILDFESVSTSFVGAALCPSISKVAEIDRVSMPAHTTAAAMNMLRKGLNMLGKWAAEFDREESLDKMSSSAVILGQSIILPGEKCFLVSSQPVSIHIPLHRFIAKVLLFASAGNVHITLNELFTSTSSNAVAALIEYPLRCLALSAQVQIGMWRRNGSPVANLVYNYSRVPLCRSLRDADLVVIQASIIKTGPEAFIAHAIRRFEILPLFNSISFQTVRDVLKLKGTTYSEKLGSLLMEFLRLLAMLTTHLPSRIRGYGTDSTSSTSTSTSSDSVDESTRVKMIFQQPLAREIAHLVLSGAQKVGSLQQVKALIGREDSIGDDELRDVIDILCIRKEGEEGEPALLELRPAAYELFDAEHPHMSHHQLQTAMDAIRSRRKKDDDEKNGNGNGTSTTTAAAAAIKTGRKPLRPVISAVAIPQSTPSFAAARTILYSPVFLGVLTRSLLLCSDEDAEKLLGAGLPNRILCRCIHLITLMIHCHASACEHISCHGAAGIMSNLGNLHDFFIVAFEAENGIAAPMLVAITKIWKNETTKDDVLYHEGLEWILQQLSALSPSAREYLISAGLEFAMKSPDSSSHAADNNKRIAGNRRKEAQKKAMEAMQRQALSFSKQMISSDINDDEEGDGDGNSNMTDGTTNKSNNNLHPDISFEDISRECIFCHERTGDPIGYLSCLQPSCVVTSSIQSGLDCPELNDIYRVVSLTGCPVFSAPSPHANELCRLPQGYHIRTGRRDGRYLQIQIQTETRVKDGDKKNDVSGISAVTGWCPVFENGTGTTTLSNSLRGERHQQSSSGSIVVHLHPVISLCFRRHGEARVHVSRCGHMMHFKCYDAFYASRSMETNGPNILIDLDTDIEYGDKCLSAAISSRQTVAVDSSRGETLCPLCKCLINALLPHTPHHISKQIYANSVPKSVGTENHDMPDACSTTDDGDMSMSMSMSMFSPQRNEEWLSADYYIDSLFALSVDNATTESSNNPVSESYSNNKNMLSSYCQTFAESCLSQYQLSFRRQVSLDLNPPCRPLYVMRALHSSWSALAYTLLCASSLPRWLEDDNNTNIANIDEKSIDGGSLTTSTTASNQRKDVELAIQMFLCARHSAHWFGEDFRETVLIPLRSLLSGRTSDGKDPSLSKGSGSGTGTGTGCRLIPTSVCRTNECEEILTSLPARVTGMPGFPNPKRTLATLSFARSKGIPVTRLWPLLRQPLLSQDLHVIAVAAVCCTSSYSESREALNTVVLARLVQILLEPICNGNLPGYEQDSHHIHNDILNHTGQRISPQELSVDVIPHLENVRNELCDISGVNKNAIHAPVGLDLLYIIYDSWMPFLQFAAVLSKVLVIAATGREKEECKDKLQPDGTGELQGFLVALGMPTLAELLQSRAVSTLIRAWSEQLHAAYKHEQHNDIVIEDHNNNITSNSTSNSTSMKESSWIPEIFQDISKDVISDIKTINGNDDNNSSNDNMYAEGDQQAATMESDEPEPEPPMMSIVANDAAEEEEQEPMEVVEQDLQPDDGGGGGNIFVTNDTTAIATATDAADITPGEQTMQMLEQQLLLLQQFVGDGSEAPSELAAMLEGLQAASHQHLLSSTSAAASSLGTWRLIGIDPMNSHIDGHRPDLLGRRHTRMSNLHSTTPLIGSFCGTRAIYGMDCNPLRNGFCDMSHLGIGLRHTAGLVRLPSLYTDLYHKFKFPPEMSGAAVEEPAICLVCGQVLCAGNRGTDARITSDPGECTLHARTCGGGTGLFFLVQMCRCLLIRGSRSCYYPSLYVDRDGEVDDSRRHNRPLFLFVKRYRRLQEMYLRHQVVIEVVRKRTSEDRLIRENWY
eukprot:gene556-1070_t